MISYVGKGLLIEEGEKILVIGDLHLGYEEMPNKSGVFVTRQMFEDMIGIRGILNKFVTTIKILKSKGLYTS